MSKRPPRVDMLLVWFDTPMADFIGPDNTPACTEDPDKWFSTDPEDLLQTRGVCEACPYRRPCLTYALDNPDVTAYGVWAGTTPVERKALRRNRPRRFRRRQVP